MLTKLYDICDMVFVLFLWLSSFGISRPDDDCHMIFFVLHLYFLWFVVLFLFCFVFLRFFFFRIPVTIFCLMVTWYLCTLPYSCTSKTSNWDSNLNRSTNKRLVKPPSQLIDELSEFQMFNFPQILPRNKDSSSDTSNGSIIIISFLQNLWK